MNAKGFYLHIYSIALRTVLLLSTKFILRLNSANEDKL